MVVKKITELKDVHMGEDIYIIASGKSCDYIDPSFFDNKLTIGINQVYKRFKTKYLLRKEPVNDKILSESGDAIHLISVGDRGHGDQLNLQNVSNKYNNHEVQIYCFDHNPNRWENITFPKKGDNKLIVSWSTITSGIHAAAYMGAKNIIILGHDCGSLDGEANFIGYHTQQTMVQKDENEYKEWLRGIENQTIQTKQYLQEQYKVNICSLNPFINFGLEGHTYSR